MAHGKAPRSYRVHAGPIHKVGLRGVGSAAGEVKTYIASPDEIEAMIQKSQEVSTKQECGSWPIAVKMQTAAAVKIIEVPIVPEVPKEKPKTIREVNCMLRPRDMTATMLKQMLEAGKSLDENGA